MRPYHPILMKKVPFIAAIWLVMSGMAFSQSDTHTLLALFGELPKFMSNDDIIKLKDGDNKISYTYYQTLGVVSDDHEVFPIGKVIVGKTVHLFYADVKYGHNTPDNYLIDISELTVDAETGKTVPSGVNFYLGMVGKDNLNRSTTFKVHDNIITFTITSIDDNGKTTTETTDYKMTTKDLEYIHTSL